MSERDDASRRDEEMTRRSRKRRATRGLASDTEEEEEEKEEEEKDVRDDDDGDEHDDDEHDDDHNDDDDDEHDDDERTRTMSYGTTLVKREKRRSTRQQNKPRKRYDQDEDDAFKDDDDDDDEFIEEEEEENDDDEFIVDESDDEPVRRSTRARGNVNRLSPTFTTRRRRGEGDDDEEPELDDDDDDETDEEDIGVQNKTYPQRARGPPRDRYVPPERERETNDEARTAIDPDSSIDAAASCGKTTETRDRGGIVDRGDRLLDDGSMIPRIRTTASLISARARWTPSRRRRDPLSGAAGGPSSAAPPNGPDVNAEITPVTVDPTLSFSSVGGLDKYVDALKEMVFLPLLYPRCSRGLKCLLREAFSYTARRAPVRRSSLVRSRRRARARVRRWHFSCVKAPMSCQSGWANPKDSSGCCSKRRKNVNRPSSFSTNSTVWHPCDRARRTRFTTLSSRRSWR